MAIGIPMGQTWGMTIKISPSQVLHKKNVIKFNSSDFRTSHCYIIKSLTSLIYWIDLLNILQGEIMSKFLRWFLVSVAVVILSACGGGGSSNQSNYKIHLSSTEKIAGYEVHLKFTNDTPNSATIDNSFLGTTGRTVNDLGADINSSNKEIKFGGFTFGTQEGVAGEFNILKFKTEDSKSEILIIKQSCIDKDANDISCDIEIE